MSPRINRVGPQQLSSNLCPELSPSFSVTNHGWPGTSAWTSIPPIPWFGTPYLCWRRWRWRCTQLENVRLLEVRSWLCLVFAILLSIVIFIAWFYLQYRYAHSWYWQWYHWLAVSFASPFMAILVVGSNDYWDKLDPGRVAFLVLLCFGVCRICVWIKLESYSYRSHPTSANVNRDWIANAAPLSTRVVKPVARCAYFCLKLSSCRSFDYSPNTGRCDLYDLRAEAIDTTPDEDLDVYVAE